MTDKTHRSSYSREKPGSLLLQREASVSRNIALNAKLFNMLFLRDRDVAFPIQVQCGAVYIFAGIELLRIVGSPNVLSSYVDSEYTRSCPPGTVYRRPTRRLATM